MARTDTLPHFLTDVADALRTKKGTSALIPANTFDTEIINLPSGGGSLQSKSITITNNGSQVVSPDTGYDGLSSVAITTAVPGGSSGEFVYDNWISYGTTEPDANSYNYWFPIATTPTAKPIRYVDNYKSATYFTGEVAELVDQTTGSAYHRSSNLPAGAVQRSGNAYLWANSGGNLTANTTLYKLTNTNDPMIKFGNTADSTAIGTLQTLLGLAGATVYGAWTVTASGDWVFGCFGSTIYKYVISTGARSSWAYFKTTVLGSSNRGLGLLAAPDNSHFLIFRTAGTSIQVIRASSGTNSSTSSYAYINVGSSNTSYVVSEIDTSTRDEFLLCYKTTGSINFTTYPLYMYKYSTNSFTQLTPPTSTGTVTIKQAAPMTNSKLFYFSALPNDVYFLENGQFVKLNNTGNLFKACFGVSLNAIASLDAPNNTFRANIPKNNFSIKDSENVSHTYNFNIENGYEYNNISGLINKTYSFGSEVLENYDSSANVLLISNYKGASSYNIQGYKFYTKPSKDIFLWIYRSGIAKFIYDKQEYNLYVSKNGEWTTNDSDNIII